MQCFKTFTMQVIAAPRPTGPLPDFSDMTWVNDGGPYGPTECNPAYGAFGQITDTGLLLHTGPPCLCYLYGNGSPNFPSSLQVFVDDVLVDTVADTGGATFFTGIHYFTLPECVASTIKLVKTTGVSGEGNVTCYFSQYALWQPPLWANIVWLVPVIVSGNPAAGGVSQKSGMQSLLPDDGDTATFVGSVSYNGPAINGEVFLTSEPVSTGTVNAHALIKVGGVTILDVSITNGATSFTIPSTGGIAKTIDITIVVTLMSGDETQAFVAITSV